MPLNSTQLATLRADINADPQLSAFAAAFAVGPIVTEYNTPGTFVVWRTDVRANEIGNAWSGTDIDGMSSLNMQRLQLLLASSAGEQFDMSRADRRAGFENPFGTNVNNTSRVAMRAVWKRFALRGERLFATGTGSDASPGTLTFQGSITDADVEAALRL